MQEWLTGPVAKIMSDSAEPCDHTLSIRQHPVNSKGYGAWSQEWLAGPVAKIMFDNAAPCNHTLSIRKGKVSGCRSGWRVRLPRLCSTMRPPTTRKSTVTVTHRSRARQVCLPEGICRHLLSLLNDYVILLSLHVHGPKPYNPKIHSGRDVQIPRTPDVPSRKPTPQTLDPATPTCTAM